MLPWASTHGPCSSKECTVTETCSVWRRPHSPQKLLGRHGLRRAERHPLDGRVADQACIASTPPRAYAAHIARTCSIGFPSTGAMLPEPPLGGRWRVAASGFRCTARCAARMEGVDPHDHGRRRAGGAHRRARHVRRAALAGRGRRVLRRVLQPAVRGDLRADLDGPRGDLPLRRGPPPRARRRRLRDRPRGVRRRARHRRVGARRPPVARGGPRHRGHAATSPTRCRRSSASWCASPTSCARRWPPPAAGSA